MPAPRGDKWETDIERRLAQLEQRRPLANTGLSAPAPGVVQADGELVVNGPIDVHGDANFDGNTTIGGSAAITGTLSLPAGIIDNDALANPVVPGVAAAYDEGFNVTTTFSERAAQNIIVPDECTRLLATVTGWIFAYNSNTTGGADGTGTDALWCFVRIGGPSNSDSKEHAHGLSGNGGFTTATSGLSVLKTALTPGSTVRIGVWAGSSFASLGTNAGNTATLSGSLLWLR